MSNEHFTVGRTLIQRGRRRRASGARTARDDDRPDIAGKTAAMTLMNRLPDPDARLYRKSDGKESRLAYLGHVLVENR